MTRIVRATTAEDIASGASLYDLAVRPLAVERFLAEPGHHLLLALDAGGRAVGFVSGVETTHPDKGTEMFLYELEVDEGSRRQGIAGALVRALGKLAEERGCYGMWVATEAENAAALATYRSAGAKPPEPAVIFVWDFES